MELSTEQRQALQETADLTSLITNLELPETEPTMTGVFINHANNGGEQCPV